MRPSIALLILTASVLAWPAAALAQELTLAQAKEGADIVVESATQCSDYKHDPAILARIREEWQQHLVDAGMSAGDADTLLDQSVASARAKPDSADAIQMFDCPTAGVKDQP
jgi:hypothetical protein